jgi:hypothetical protein
VRILLLFLLLVLPVRAEEQAVEHHRRRITSTMQLLGVPLSPGETLDDRVLVRVQINPEQRVKVEPTANAHRL